MTTARLFQWVFLKQDVANSPVKAGDRAVVVDQLPATQNQPETGYLLEVFKDGQTLDVVAVPVSWVTPLPEMWGTENLECDQADLKVS